MQSTARRYLVQRQYPGLEAAHTLAPAKFHAATISPPTPTDDAPRPAPTPTSTPSSTTTALTSSPPTTVASIEHRPERESAAKPVQPVPVPPPPKFSRAAPSMAQAATPPPTTLSDTPFPVFDIPAPARVDAPTKFPLERRFLQLTSELQDITLSNAQLRSRAADVEGRIAQIKAKYEAVEAGLPLWLKYAALSRDYVETCGRLERALETVEDNQSKLAHLAETAPIAALEKAKAKLVSCLDRLGPPAEPGPPSAEAEHPEGPTATCPPSPPSKRVSLNRSTRSPFAPSHRQPHPPPPSSSSSTPLPPPPPPRRQTLRAVSVLTARVDATHTRNAYSMSSASIPRAKKDDILPARDSVQQRLREYYAGVVTAQHQHHHARTISTTSASSSLAHSQLRTISEDAPLPVQVEVPEEGDQPALPDYALRLLDELALTEGFDSPGLGLGLKSAVGGKPLSLFEPDRASTYESHHPHPSHPHPHPQDDDEDATPREREESIPKIPEKAPAKRADEGTRISVGIDRKQSFMLSPPPSPFVASTPVPASAPGHHTRSPEAQSQAQKTRGGGGGPGKWLGIVKNAPAKDKDKRQNAGRTAKGKVDERPQSPGRSSTTSRRSWFWNS
ncbi:hypothetical protein BOTBODRAFT_33490 [Botryobasidium botryosum FD-172 SS1]|uniref:Uncharacterized protein n=1 Tax=Botryobasidium botryosum (strain FD-172 SS1) TaxID=930990 RepID=A0A067MFJ4_BOTB1|nr:hypothetical protein BOTBODRAFT_33490 [Botryobasidium botryosum FD-172 SS1]